MEQVHTTSSIQSKPPLAQITKATIIQFEREQHDALRLLARLQVQNQELSQWLRRRARELAPDIEDREAITTLALELAAIIANQSTIHDLSRFA